MALPDVPLERPKWIPFALVVVLMTLAGVALGVSIMGKRPSGPEGEGMKVQAVASSSSSSASPPEASGSNAPTQRGRPIPRRSCPPLLRSSFQRLRRNTRAAPAVGASTMPAAAAAAAAPGPGTFNPATASAALRVTKATGASPADVRAALPSWRYTSCYRDALRKANKRLEGKVVLQLTIDASGSFTRMNAVGPESLLSSVGACLQDATGANAAPLKEVSPAGATAEVELLFNPE